MAETTQKKVVGDVVEVTGDTADTEHHFPVGIVGVVSEEGAEMVFVTAWHDWRGYRQEGWWVGHEDLKLLAPHDLTLTTIDEINQFLQEG